MSAEGASGKICGLRRCVGDVSAADAGARAMSASYSFKIPSIEIAQAAFTAATPTGVCKVRAYG
jgi:hypothetical protein